MKSMTFRFLMLVLYGLYSSVIQYGIFEGFNTYSKIWRVIIMCFLPHEIKFYLVHFCRWVWALRWQFCPNAYFWKLYWKPHFVCIWNCAIWSGVSQNISHNLLVQMKRYNFILNIYLMCIFHIFLVDSIAFKSNILGFELSF